MPVIDVADVIRARLGAPTVSALAARFGADGTCPECGTRFGAARLSLCAFADDAEHVTLVAYHAACRATAWLEGELTGGDPAAEPPRPVRAPTWQAALTSCMTPMPPRPGRRAWRRSRRPRALQMPLLVVHPRLESSRVRLVGAGETVDAELEELAALGFADAGDLAVNPLTAVGAARLMTAGRESASLVVRAGFDTWAAPIGSPSLRTLITARGGTLVAVGSGCDPYALAADPAALATALDRGDLLLGWAPLHPA